MSQFDFGTIDPATKSGTVLASDLNSFRDAVFSSHKGSSAPSYIAAGMTWVNDSVNPWVLYLYDGTDSIAIGSINTTTNVFTPAGFSSILVGIANGTTPTSSKNKIINGNFSINQRNYVSGAVVGAGLYGHDRWKMAASGDTYTYATVANVTTVTIPAGKVLRQVIEGVNLQSGTHTLSWAGTAQGKIGSGSLSASGVTGTVTGGTNVTIEFGPGTVSMVQFEEGSIATPFENRPIGLELALCQRYYEECGTPGNGELIISGVATAAGQVIYAPFKFAVVKRGSPTMTLVGTFGVANSSQPTISAPSIYGYRLSITSVAAGGFFSASSVAGNTVTASSEL